MIQTECGRITLVAPKWWLLGQLTMDHKMFLTTPQMYIQLQGQAKIDQ